MPEWRLVLGDGRADAGGRAGGLAAARGATNMAIDHALFEGVQAGGRPVLRLYCWQPACLSFGRNQHAAGVYDPARLHAAGVDVVRRPTGGLAVLHDRELTYSIIVPAQLLGGPRATYRRVNQGLVEGLRTLGVPAALAGPAPPRDPRHNAALPCFQAPADGEVVVHGRKLVGSAQRCERHTLLQHGSILLDGTQQHVLSLLCTSAAAVAAAAATAARPVMATAGPARAAVVPGDAGPITLRDVLRPGPEAGDVTLAVVSGDAGSITLRDVLGAVPDAGEVARAVAAGVARVCGIRLAPAALSRTESARAAELEAVYTAADWTWRR